MRITRHQLIARTAAATGQTHKAATATVLAFLDAISSALSAGDTVTMGGFGLFSVHKRNKAFYVHPKTGRPGQIDGYRFVEFSAASSLKKRVNTRSLLDDALATKALHEETSPRDSLSHAYPRPLE